MKLRLPKDKIVDFSFTKVMGTIALEKDDPRSIDDLVMLATTYVKAGAEFIEIGAKRYGSIVDETRIPSVVGAILNSVDVPVALNSNSKEIIEQCINAGVSMIITTDGLSSEGVLDVVKNTEVAACLSYSPKEKITDDKDVVSLVSEFFYARLDACLEAGITRKQLLIDPSVVRAPIRARLKLLGRLDSFRSFALPMCVALPHKIPQDDPFLKENRTLALTTAIFCSSAQSVQIIRTDDVSQIALAIGFWQIMSNKTKPYRLSKTIIRRLRDLRDTLRDIKSIGAKQ